MNRIVKIVLQAKTEWLDNIEGLKSSLRLSSRKIDLKKIEPNKPNAELGL